MKKKKIWIPIVSLVLVAALGSGLALYFTQKPGKVVGVYDSNELITTYWGDEKSSSGPVTTDKLQTVFLSATQEVTKVHVQEGQKVAKGTTLLTYDTTLSQLSLDRKDLEIQRTKLRLEDAQDQLASIKKMKPISYTTPKPTTTKPSTTQPSTTASGSVKPKEELGERQFMELGGTGTSGDPKIIWVRQSQVFNDKFIAELLGSAKELYTILEVRRSDKAAGTVLSRTGVFFQATEETISAPAVSTASQQEAGNYGVHLLTDVTADPGDESSQNPSNEPTDESEPSTPSEEPPTPPETSEPPETSGPPEPTPGPVTIVRYSFTFFQVDEKQTTPAPTQPTGSSGSSGGSDVNMNSGYTSNEIAQMRADKEAEIKQLQFDIKMAEAEYKIMKKEFDNGEVKSDIDGYVVSVLNPEEALANNEPVVKVSGGGGFFIQASVGELDRDSLEIGQTVQIMSWSTGANCEGTITAIGDYPTSDGYYRGDGNPSVSYYPFTVSVDESQNLEAGTYVQVSYGSTTEVDNGFYLRSAFIRTEEGKSYVYVQGADGVLEKREVKTGPSLWGSFTKIYSGMDQGDYIAFPYGVKEGAPTEVQNLSDLYQYY